MSKNNVYDVIIIGAGISGLVCGCYLAKNKKKVIIFEKNDHPGGCCTSFIKNGVLFDSAAHSLGGMSEDGPIGVILDDLGINKSSLKRTNPSYVLEVQDYKISFWNNFEDTIEQLTKDFVNETQGIRDFFKFISEASSVSLIKIKNLNFEQLLNQYIQDKKLQSIFYAPLLGNVGLDPRETSAFTAVKFYQQYVLDGGYHFDGGMQVLPELLMKKFCELGGEVRFNDSVQKILLANNKANGVIAGGKDYLSNYVVSNIDGRGTFLNLIGIEKLETSFVEKIDALQTSSSMYMLYYGLNGTLVEGLEDSVTYWFVSDYSVERFYENIDKDNLSFDWFAVRFSRSRKSLQAFTIAPSMDEYYWKENGLVWKEKFMQKVSEKIPSISTNTNFVMSATPKTIFDWTGNSGGATCGWRSSGAQFNIAGLSQKTPVLNLYLTGHWTTITLGVPGVANIGKSTAIFILQKM